MGKNLYYTEIIVIVFIYLSFLVTSKINIIASVRPLDTFSFCNTWTES